MVIRIITLPEQWTEDDLESLIANQVFESLQLDYKESAALKNTDGCKNEISKDVSSFANSAGGVIVYGMVENGQLPTNIDVGCDPTVITKEWLEQVINSRIQRRIDGVKINQIWLKGSNPARVIYIVIIPQSTMAPHMAHDKKYYKRFNFQSVAMEDYEVRDVSRRSEVPDLFIKLELDPNPLNPVEPNTIRLGLRVLIGNNSAMPADYAIINLFVDTGIDILDHRQFTILPPQVNISQIPVFSPQSCIVNRLTYNWSVTGGEMPVWEGTTFNVSEPFLILQIPSVNGRYNLYWTLRSPKMEMRYASSVIVNTAGQVNIS